MAKVLITGGSGFIGSWVARYLYEADFDIALLLRPTSAIDSLRNITFDSIIGDLTSPETLNQIEKPFDYIIHAGGEIKAVRSKDYYQVNTFGTENLISVARRLRVKGFILFSSLAAAVPVSHYGRSKLEAEAVVKKSGLPYTILRLPVVYGPGDSETGRLFRLLKKGIGLLPGQDHRLSIIYVEDVARFVTQLLKSGSLRNQTIYLTDGRVYHLSDILKIGSFLLRKRMVLVRIPPAILILTVPILDPLLKGRSPITRDKVRELIQKDWICPNREPFPIKFDIELGLRKMVDFLARTDKI